MRKLARRQQGFHWGAGPRDAPKPIAGVAARLDRAQANFMETVPYFAAAVLAAAVCSKLESLTLWRSDLYVVGRVVDLPLYAAGIPYVRTLVWHVATSGLVMVVVALFR